MSHYGVARDLLAALKFKKLLPSNSALIPVPEKQKKSIQKKCQDKYKHPKPRSMPKIHRYCDRKYKS
jgi:hypothetical protein